MSLCREVEQILFIGRKELATAGVSELAQEVVIRGRTQRFTRIFRGNQEAGVRFTLDVLAIAVLTLGRKTLTRYSPGVSVLRK